MNPLLTDLEFGVASDHLTINRVKSNYQSMTDFHMHTYYEFSFILSGDVKVLFSDRAFACNGSCLVLSRPYAMHYIIPRPLSGYERINILFTQEYVTGSLHEWEPLLSIFGPSGSFMTLSEEQMQQVLSLCEQIQAEENPLTQKLLLFLLLSRVAGLPGRDESLITPKYLCEVLQYILTHYEERLVAQELADRFLVSRTKLMCDFRTFTGYTLGDYVTSIRLKNAQRMMAQQQMTLSEVAERSGFSSSSNMIRVFRRELGTTPSRLGRS